MRLSSSAWNKYRMSVPDPMKKGGSASNGTSVEVESVIGARTPQGNIEGKVLNDHKMFDIGSGMLDQYECSCGWKSNSFFDGAEWAYKEFVQHLKLQ